MSEGVYGPHSSKLPFLGSGLLENDSPFQIGVMEKEAQTSIMHSGIDE